MLFRRFAIVLTVALAQTASLAVGQVTLKPKVIEGAAYKTRESTKVTQILSIAGQNINTMVDVTIMSHTVNGERDAEKKLTYKTTFDSVVADLELPGAKIKFDSASPDAKSDSPIGELALDRLRKLKDLTLTITLDGENQVVSVDGIKEGSGIGIDEIKGTHKERLNRLPAEAVTPGDTWERTEEMNLGEGQIFIVKRKYEYAGTAPKFATVKDSKQLDKITATDLSVEYTVKGDTNPIKVNESDLKVASTKHTYLFDRESGRMVDHQGELQVKGSLKLSIMGMDLDATLDLKFETRNQEID